MRASELARCHCCCSIAVRLVSWRSVVGNVAVVVRCCCRCRAVVSSCHHGDGHASALISVPDCECSAFQGRSGRLCVHTQQVDLLTPGFKAAPPPIVTSHVNANGSHRPAPTRMMDSVTTATGIPCCLGLQGVRRTVAPVGFFLIKTQQNIFLPACFGGKYLKKYPIFPSSHKQQAQRHFRHNTLLYLIYKY